MLKKQLMLSLFWQPFMTLTGITGIPTDKPGGQSTSQTLLSSASGMVVNWLCVSLQTASISCQFAPIKLKFSFCSHTFVCTRWNKLGCAFVAHKPRMNCQHTRNTDFTPVQLRLAWEVVCRSLQLVMLKNWVIFFLYSRCVAPHQLWASDEI